MYVNIYLLIETYSVCGKKELHASMEYKLTALNNLHGARFFSFQLYYAKPVSFFFHDKRSTL